MSTRVHRDDARGFLIGVGALIAAAVIAYVGLAAQTGGKLPAKSYTEVTARFDNVGALKPKQKVVESGIRIGQVSEIQYGDGEAVVTLRLDGTQEVHADASASVRTESALGRKYISLDRGTKEAGPLGSEGLAASATAATTDIDGVLDTFTPEARKGLATGLQSLGGGLFDAGPDLNVALDRAPQLMDDGRTVLQAVNAPESDLTGLLRHTEELAASFEGREDEVTSLLTSARSTLEAVYVDDGQPLSQTLEKAPDTLVAARTTLQDLEPTLKDVQVATKTLRPGVADLTASVPDLRGFLTGAVEPAGKVPGVSEDAVPAVDSLQEVVDEAPDLIDRTTRLLGDAGPLLETLQPYVPDAGGLVANYGLLSGNYGPDKHYFSMMLALPGIYNASAPDPLYQADPYPAPGEALGRHGGR